MKVLNLRNVPDELVRALKAEAALADVPFHPFCIRLLASAVNGRRPAPTELRHKREAMTAGGVPALYGGKGSGGTAAGAALHPATEVEWPLDSPVLDEGDFIVASTEIEIT